MKIIDTLKRSARNLRHAKVRTLLTASAIAVGGFTLAITLAASTGARNLTDKLIQSNFDPNSILVARDKSLFGSGTNKIREYDDSLGSAYGVTLKQLDQQDIKELRAVPHVKEVVENYDISIQYVTRTEGGMRYTGQVQVYDDSQKPTMKAGVAPAALESGTLLLPDDYVQALNFTSAKEAIGETVVIQIRRLTGATDRRDFKVAGVTTKSSFNIDGGPLPIQVSQEDARSLNNYVNGGTVNAGKLPTVIVQGDGSVTPDELQSQLKAAGYEAYTSKDIQKFINQIISILQGIIVVFGLITLIASFFGVVNTQYISVLERTREIGLMKALGMSRRTVSRLFIIEATWIGFLGALLGSVLAIAAGTALNPWISKKLELGSDHLLVFSPLHIAALIVFLMFITTVAGLLPARKAAKLDPIEALRTE